MAVSAREVGGSSTGMLAVDLARCLCKSRLWYIKAPVGAAHASIVKLISLDFGDAGYGVIRVDLVGLVPGMSLVPQQSLLSYLKRLTWGGSRTNQTPKTQGKARRHIIYSFRAVVARLSSTSTPHRLIALLPLCRSASLSSDTPRRG